MIHRILSGFSISYLLKVIALFIIYYITADFGLRLDAVSGFATLFWLPSGISLASLLLFGYRLFPAVFLGATVINHLYGAPPGVALGIGVGNTLEALIGWYFLQRFIKFNPSLERLSDVLGLVVFASFLSTAVSATVGVTSLLLGGVLTVPYASAWAAWWIGDAISMLITAPFILVWNKKPEFSFSLNRMVEAIFLTLSVIAVGIFVFGGVTDIHIPTSPFSYLLFPPIIWAALRFGQREVVTFVFAVSLLAIWGTVQGYGPFVTAHLSQSLLYLQSFMAVMAATSMLLAAAVAERRELERRKDDFITFASHEFKTPLTSIMAFTQILQKSFAHKKDRQAMLYLSRMNQQLNKLNGLIYDMLDLSRIQTGNLELRKDAFSLQELIEETVDVVQHTTQHTIIKRGIDTAAFVYGDRDRIAQVISNLLSNAIKYSSPGRSIVVTLKNGRSQITVSIADKGVGIAERYQAKIFDRFYRIADTSASRSSGLGIGLYLSKMIIARHGGDIWLKSKEGKGTTFYFSLPVSKLT